MYTVSFQLRFLKFFVNVQSVVNVTLKEASINGKYGVKLTHEGCQIPWARRFGWTSNYVSAAVHWSAAPDWFYFLRNSTFVCAQSTLTEWIGKLSKMQISSRYFRLTCCLHLVLVLKCMTMLWRRGSSMRSTRFGRKTHLSSMTWWWLMRWSGPVLLSSGSQMSAGICIVYCIAFLFYCS